MEMGNKVVCIWVLAKDDKIRRDWYAADPRSNDGAETEEGGRSVLMEKMGSPNSFHEQIMGFGTAIMDHKIYLIGGIYKAGWPHYHQQLNTVSIYDTVTSTWTQGPPMKANRIPLAVIVVAHKIYVFGTFRQFKQDVIAVDQWAECYDSSLGEWTTIPGPHFFDPPSGLLDLADYAVVRHADEIRFFAHGRFARDPPHFFVFNLSSHTWTSANLPGPETPPVNFSTNHVMYGGEFALWHWEGGIFAWELSTNKTSLLFRLEDKAKWGWSRHRDPSDPAPVELLDLGNGLMCILYWGWTPKYRYRLVCYTFQMLHPLRLGETAVRYYNFPNGCYMSKAIALSPQDVAFQTTN